MKGFVHISGDLVLKREDIVGVFDLDNTSWSYLTRELLADAQKKEKVKSTGEDLPRSFILCANGMIILTQPTAKAIARRLENLERIYG